jgi:hypothetical protein
MARLWHLPDAIRTALNSGHSPTMSRHLFGRYSARSDADTRFGALNTELVVDAARSVRRPPRWPSYCAGASMLQFSASLFRMAAICAQKPAPRDRMQNPAVLLPRIRLVVLGHRRARSLNPGS